MASGASCRAFAFSDCDACLRQEESGDKRRTHQKRYRGKEKYEDYAEKAASELEKVISRMEGAGKVKVMMTVSSSSEKVVEKDEETAEDEKQRTKNETTVYEEMTGDRRLMSKRSLSPLWKEW